MFPSKSKRPKLCYLIAGLSLLLTPNVVTAEVREAANLAAILPVITDDTLVIFDLDNTVIEPTTTLGGDQWFTQIVKDYLGEGYSEREATDRAVIRWSEVQTYVRAQPVEPTTAAVICDLQKRGLKVIALTARPSSILKETLRELREVGVDFTKSPVFDHDLLFDMERPVFYSQGILSVNNTNKGLALLKLLELAGIQPAHIVFVDDKLKNVANVNDALNANVTIPHIEFRYGAADPKVAGYQHILALFQEQLLGKILSDEDALFLMTSATEN